MAWLKAVRDHPDKPAPMQCHVLTMLAVRMDWKSGDGFASMQMLAEDARVSQHTAKRATTWARRPCKCDVKGAECAEHRLLHRIRRGSSTAVASVWQLELPSERSTDGTLNGAEGSNGTSSRIQRATLKVPAETDHQDPGPQDPGSSANGDGAKAPRPPFAQPETPLPPPCPDCGVQLTREQFDALDADWQALTVAEQIVAVTIETCLIVRDVRYGDAAAFPGYGPDTSDAALARRVIGELLDAGWTMPRPVTP